MVLIMVVVASVFFLVGRRPSETWHVRLLSAFKGLKRGHDETLVHRSRLLELREEGGGVDQEQIGSKGLGESFEQVLVPTEEVIEVAAAASQ